MSTDSVTTNTENTNCDKAFMVSKKSDGFTNGPCVQMSTSKTGEADFSDTDKSIFWITPSGDLSADTTYDVRITNAVKDNTRFGISSNFDNGHKEFTFVTGSGVAGTWLLPDPTTDLQYRPSIRISFDTDISNDTVTTNTDNTNCDKSFQISTATDNFAASSCIQMVGVDATRDASGNSIFTIAPNANLSDATEDYIARIIAPGNSDNIPPIEDASGNPISIANPTLSFQTASAFEWRLPDTGYMRDNPDVTGDDGEQPPRHPLSYTKIKDNDNSSDVAILDNNTGLFWQNSKVSDNGKKTKPLAASYCQTTLNIEGKKGWRLPTIKEFIMFADYGNGRKEAPILHPDATFLPYDSDYYWSSTDSKTNSGSSWVIHVGTGAMAGIDNTTTQRNFICVRDSW